MSRQKQQEAEPLYLVLLHDPQAEHRLRTWHNSNPTAAVQINGNRMKIYDQRSLGLLQVTWRGHWDNLVIWDTWNRRHLYTE